MSPFRKGLVAISLSIGCLLWGHPGCYSQTISDQLLLHGTVTDRSGSPIEDAIISWIPTTVAYRALPLTSTKFPSCQTGIDGKFSMSPAIEELKRILHPTQGDARAVVSKSGFRTTIIDVSVNRMLAGDPVSVRLLPASSLPLTVLDCDGTPLKDVTVSPATLDGQSLPFYLLPQHQVVTDDRGQAELPGIQVGSVTHVYLQNQPYGAQRVEIRWDENRAIAQAIPLQTYSGRLEAPDDSNLNLSQVKLLFKVADDARSATERCVWESMVDADGKFEVVLSKGNVISAAELPSDWPYSVNLYEQMKAIDHDQCHISLRLEPAVQVTGQIIDQATQQGMPGIMIEYSYQDRRPCETGADGRFSFFSITKTHDYLPWDPTGNFVYPKAVYHRPQQTPQANRVDATPLSMVACHPGLGQVVDEQGNAVPGARIECTFKNNRFNQTIVIYSRTDGSFRFHSIPPKSVVDLSVRAGHLGTPEPVSVRLRRTPDVRLQVKALREAFFSGKVVTANGLPVNNARVTIRKGIVFEEEMVNGRDRFPVNLFDTLSFSTDSSGQYRSESTVDWEQDTSIQINAVGFEPYYSPWSTRRPNGSGGKQIATESVTLTPIAPSKKIRVSVLDEFGEAVDSYRVVFLGAKSGHVKRTVNNEANAHLTLVDSPQLAAVIAEGYLPDVKILQQLTSEEISFQLRPISSPTPQRQSRVMSDQQTHSYMSKLLAMLPEPADSGSLAQRSSYYSIYSYVNPSDLVTRIKKGEIIGGRKEYLQAFGGQIARMPTEEILRLMPDLDHRMRMALNMQLAKRTQPSHESQQYLSEAIIAAGELGGDDRLNGTAYLVCMMLEFGLHDLGRQHLQDCFQEHQELAALLENTQRSEDRIRPGMARIFAPLYAMIDPEKSFRLIELGAYANEIEMLKSNAVAFCLATGGQWQTWYERLGKDRFTPRGLVWYHHMFRFMNAESALQLASLRPDVHETPGFLLKFAETVSSKEDGSCIALIRSAVEILKSCDNSITSVKPSQLAAEAAVLARGKDDALAEQALFESLWLCENDHYVMPYTLVGNLAQTLVAYDVELAKTLVEPCFENWSWLFENDQSVTYQLNPPFAALAVIDPDLTLKNLSGLQAQELAQQLSRQYTLASAIAQSWVPPIDE